MSGFSVDDPEAARAFYEDVLGLRVEVGDHGFLRLSGRGRPRRAGVPAHRSTGRRRTRC